MPEAVKLAIAGLGTVGAGVVELIQTQTELMAKRAGREIEIRAVSARDRGRDRGVDISAYQWFDDADHMAATADVDVVVELIGGEDGIAKAVVEAAIAAGRDVVTANKALLARHGESLALAAEAQGVALDYEAAVAGGIPIVKAMREGLAGNRIDRVYGILNGTCNYILTEMQETGGEFSEILADAQALGYAEADPSFDIDGIDAAHKLAIMASLAFGMPVDFDAIEIEGIAEVEALDIAFARELGYRIKLLAIARRAADGIEQRVHPCMVGEATPIAAVNGVFNAVVAEGDFVDRTVYEGRGAGAGPTASAVVADIMDIARGNRPPTFSVPATDLERLPRADPDRRVGAHYIRLTVVDRPGVIAEISAILRDEEISIESLLQRGRAPGEPVGGAVILITHETTAAAMARALAQIGALQVVQTVPKMIRIEML